MNCVCDAQIFTKIDVKNAYYHIHICEGDEWKTIFCIWYRLYEYLITFFSLTNASVSFQSYIHEVLCEYLDIFMIIFLNTILIYSTEEGQHKQHVQTILKALLTAELFVKLLKCLFSVKHVLFLRYVLTDTEVEMKADQIFIIINWSESESVCEVQTFLSFVNLYCRFIQSFSYIAAPLTEITQRSNAKSKKKLISQRANFLSSETQTAFRALVLTFTTALFLQHFEVELSIHLKTDTFKYVISGILSQKYSDS